MLFIKMTSRCIFIDVSVSSIYVERERCHVFRIRMLDPLLRHWFYQTCSLGFQPPLKQWVEKYNHHCLPKGFNHPNWVNHYFNGGGSPAFSEFFQNT